MQDDPKENPGQVELQTGNGNSHQFSIPASFLISADPMDFSEIDGPIVEDSPSKKAEKIGTILTLVPPLDIPLGSELVLSGTINDWSGTPIADASIQFSINGTYLSQTRSDATGFFQDRVRKVFDAGVYAITASFNGTTTLSYASAATTLKVLPADVKIQTIPPVSGVTFQLNETRFVTGDDGSATIKVNQAGTYRLEALTDLYDDPNQRIEFGRWMEAIYRPVKNVEVPTNRVIQAGLFVYHLVGQSFIDRDGLPVDTQRITEFSIRSEQGDTFVFNTGEPRWIIASRIAHRSPGLVVSKLLYSVVNVKLDGSNVVNESQQQFYAEPNDNWKITLLLYSLKVTVHDGLFGSPIGKSVDIVYPDDQVKNYPLDSTGSVEIHSLARGNYTVKAVGVSGMGNTMPVALSRSQAATMKVLTYFDIAVVGILGGIIALALLLYGRRETLLPALMQRRTLPSMDQALLEVDDILPADGKGAQPKDELIKWS